MNDAANELRAPSWQKSHRDDIVYKIEWVAIGTDLLCCSTRSESRFNTSYVFSFPQQLSENYNPLFYLIQI
jgi:hypothetical protein